MSTHLAELLKRTAQPTILVVMYDQSIMNIVVLSLEILHLQCFTANTFNQALKVMEETKPNVLITDIAMPGDGDGLTLALIARKLGRQVLIVSPDSYGHLSSSVVQVAQQHDMRHVPLPAKATIITNAIIDVLLAAFEHD